MNPAEWLLRAARLTPSAPALLVGETVVADYEAFARQAAGIGAGLRGFHGLERGERVALFLSNRAEYLPALYGIWFAGGVAVPINAKLHGREASWIVENSGARIAFASGAQAEALAEAAPAGLSRIIDPDGPDFDALGAAGPMPVPCPMDPEDLAWLFYTSGTTGRPKGVMIPARAIEAMALSYFADVDAVTAADAALYAAPMSHGAGLYNFMHVIRGARHVVPASGGFDPAEILELGRRLGSVHMFAAPTMVRRLVAAAKAQGATGEGIRTIVYGGGPMYAADIEEAVRVMGPRFVQIYGQGECPMCITALTREEVADRTHPRWRERLASVGHAQSAVQLRVADSDGRALPPGEVGEILARGTPVMDGYWRAPKASAEALRGGWLWTGDMGALDEDGFLTLHDRSKDVIISGGTNIYPREVEEALLTHPALAEVSVIGRPHPDWGEEVVAFVVAEPGQDHDPSALDAHCRGLIAGFKRPKAYIPLPALPKNNYGKVLKTELRKRLETEKA